MITSWRETKRKKVITNKNLIWSKDWYVDILRIYIWHGNKADWESFHSDCECFLYVYVLKTAANGDTISVLKLSVLMLSSVKTAHYTVYIRICCIIGAPNIAEG